MMRYISILIGYVVLGLIAKPLGFGDKFTVLSWWYWMYIFLGTLWSVEMHTRYPVFGKPHKTGQCSFFCGFEGPFWPLFSVLSALRGLAGQIMRIPLPKLFLYTRLAIYKKLKLTGWQELDLDNQIHRLVDAQSQDKGSRQEKYEAALEEWQKREEVLRGLLTETDALLGRLRAEGEDVSVTEQLRSGISIQLEVAGEKKGELLRNTKQLGQNDRIVELALDRLKLLRKTLNIMQGAEAAATLALHERTLQEAWDGIAANRVITGTIKDQELAVISALDMPVEVQASSRDDGSQRDEELWSQEVEARAGRPVANVSEPLVESASRRSIVRN